MAESNKNPLAYTIAAVVFAAIGIAVFAIRLGHPGPYAMPTGMAPIGALAALALSGYLLWPGKPKYTGGIAVLLGVVACLAPIYSIVGESEEVISLYVIDNGGNRIDLRLWIVDREDGPWVGMGRAKAIENKLHGSQLQMLRGGESICVVPTLVDEDRSTVQIIHRMKVEKYRAAQIAAAVGMYPPDATPNTVALRLDPC
ncbi:MAG: hypothetical protein ACE37D_18455 [Pseudomonadales bacterium]